MAQQNLRRDITVVLAIKISIVLAASFFVFSPRQRPHIDVDAIQQKILNDSVR